MELENSFRQRTSQKDIGEVDVGKAGNEWAGDMSCWTEEKTIDKEVKKVSRDQS
jgi:hypothetical protein